MGSLVLLSCAGDGDRPVSVGEEGGPVQTLQRILLRESAAGKLRWVLRADSARSYGDEDRTLLMGVDVDFYNAGGDTIRSWLTALEGEIDPASHDLTARGDVLIRTREGQRLETQVLWWDNESGKVRSNHFVRLTDGDNVLKGVGIESDPELKEYTIQSHVKGEFYDGGSVLDEKAP